MSTLLLRLAGPMQSWGVGSKFDIRATQKEPTKSGVIGLLAAAMGVKRDDSDTLEKLSQLRFGIRVDQEGTLLKDFHIAHSVKSSYVTYRYYLCDAVFLCGLESDNQEELLQYENALRHPVFPLFLGRRSCSPTLPIVLGIREYDLETALKNEKPLTENPGMMRIVVDALESENTRAIVKDVPVSFNPRRREYSYRKYRETILPGNKQMEHNPFAEVEAENVSDANGVE